MKKFNITIQGTSPLLMNRPSQLDIADKSKDVKRETQTPEEIAENNPTLPHLTQPYGRVRCGMVYNLNLFLGIYFLVISVLLIFFFQIVFLLV